MSQWPITTSSIRYDPTSPAFHQDPYPHFRRLREVDPVHLTPGGWVLTRHQDCAEVLRSRTFGMHGLGPMLRRNMGVGPAAEFIANRFHSYDPPEHTRLRSLVAQPFTPHRVQGLRRRVHALTEHFLDQLGDAESFDLIERFARPLPLRVISEVLGTPLGDSVRLSSWTDQILRLQGTLMPSKMLLSEGNAAARDFMAYMRQLIEVRRGTQADDVLSALISAEERGNRLTAEEIAECVVFLCNAGHTTTRHMIGSAVVALLSNRDQWAMLVDDPTLVGEAVEEALRYNCSLVSTIRFAREPTTIGTRRIAAGAAVSCLLNAANRDPARFPDPDRFDIARADKKHLAFGGGVHLCLGAALGRLQIRIALDALVRRFPEMRLSGDRIEWQGGLYRGPVRVPVIVGARG